MDIDKRFTHAHRPLKSEDETPKDYYIKCLVSSLYTVGRVSNTTYPIPLPNFDDDADLLNILKALNTLSEDITGMLADHFDKL